MLLVVSAVNILLFTCKLLSKTVHTSKDLVDLHEATFQKCSVLLSPLDIHETLFAFCQLLVAVNSDGFYIVV